MSIYSLFDELTLTLLLFFIHSFAFCTYSCCLL
jgi:hypothetical protein